MNPMITSYDLERATGRVTCNGDKGTCFLISANLAITAAHVVKQKKEDENKQVTIEFLKISAEPIETEANLLYYDLSDDNDIAILELKIPVNLDKYVPLMSMDVANGAFYQIFGYPNKEYTAGKRFEGKVSSTNDFHTKWDLDINLQKPYDTRGLSGAALMIGNHAVGFVVSQLHESIHAISIKKIKLILENNDIPFTEHNLNQDIPETLKEESEDSIESTNTPVMEELDACLAKTNGQYALLSGSPGSGKTTIVTKYAPQSEKIKIAGTYFIKVPSDSEALANRATKERLLEWLESVYYRTLQNRPAEKNQKELDKRIQQLGHFLAELGTYYKAKNEVGVLIIDGLDDANKHKAGNLADFLSILPNTLPEHLSVLFSCTNKAVLPNDFQAQISEKQEVKVAPLSKEKTERFIRKKLKAAEIELSNQQILLLTNKSEGHPLYLQYLVKYIIHNQPRVLEESDNLNGWLAKIPTIDGNIKVYYKTIWNTLKNNSEEVKIIGTISRLRQKAPTSSIPQMLSADSREQWDMTYHKVVHLLSHGDEEDPLIGIYHSSFGDFFQDSTKQQNDFIHHRIAQYCKEHQETIYGLSNLIYHLYSGDDNNKQEAIEFCQQEWVDNCALNSVLPDFILTDVRAVLQLCFDFKLSVEVIRVLLLLQRVRFRYDEMFKEYAFELANLLIAMGKPQDAIKYIIRNGELLISENDALSTLQRLYEANGFQEAKNLLEVLDSLYRQKLTKDYKDGHMDFSNLLFKFNMVSISSSSNPEKANREFKYFYNRIKNLEGVLEKNRPELETLSQLRIIIVAIYCAYTQWALDQYIPAKFLIESGNLVNEETTLMWVMRIAFFEQFRKISFIKSHKINKNTIADLEMLIQEYNLEDTDKEKAVLVLMPYSKNSNLIKTLMQKSPVKKLKEFSVREKNGVNADIKNILQEIEQQTKIGYLSDNNQIQPFPTYIYWENWESNLNLLIQKIGFLFGRAYHLKATNDIERLKLVISDFKSFVNKLSFDLNRRLDWRHKRAYALPEEILPVLYQKTTQFILEFCPEYTSEFVDFILKDPQNQLGLFTEGYRNSLIEIAEELVADKNHRSSTFKILEHLKEYIYRGVQNRWERVPELMKLAELYARIPAKEKAEEVFKMMLDSSMGISWYKEAQLDLITTAIENLHDDSSDYSKLPTLAGHLDFASGEMTFQRYIKNGKRAIYSFIMQN